MIQMDELRKVLLEPLNITKELEDATGKSFHIIVSIPAKKEQATINIVAAKRPFPLESLRKAIKAIGGTFWRKHTLLKFAMVERTVHASPVILKVKFYMKECLNPEAIGKIPIQKGLRGRVLKPELCDGAEVSIMRGLGIEEVSK